MTREYQVCTQCVMDTTDPSISFDDQGVCNYCQQYSGNLKQELHRDEPGRQALQALISRIKRKGAGRDYDCIIGVSGGIDSTYVAYLVKRQFGLRPLAVHLDNGWDSELAVANIENVLKRLDIDLYTHVLDWEEFKDLQLAFLESSISNAEIPTDHAIKAILYRTAAARGVSHIITGSNFITEAFMPWMYDAMDLRLVGAVHRQFGKRKLKTFPTLGLLDYIYYVFAKGIQTVPILNFLPYEKENAKRVLENELGWRDYGGKHRESLYTRFFQSYILPKKFNIDKRKAHLSCMILSGQMTREQALQELAQPPCSSEELEGDAEYFIKKLGLTYSEFDAIMCAPVRDFSDYPNQDALHRRFSFVAKFARQRILRDV